MSDLEDIVEEGRETEDLEAIPLPYRVPMWPTLVRASGLYTWSAPIMGPLPRPRWPSPIRPIPEMPTHGPRPGPQPDPVPVTDEVDDNLSADGDESMLYPIWFLYEEMRLDVDGLYPQMVASGTVKRGMSTRVHWVANLTARGHNRWVGSIWYKDGNASSFPYTNIEIRASLSWFPNQRRITAVFSGGGAPVRRRTYKYKSPYYHSVEFEYDRVAGATEVSRINTTAHPNHPATLPAENLSIETVFKRAGFDVRKSRGDGEVPISEAHANATWSDMEMHDAMQTYWSRFRNQAQWSMWTLFAGRHDQGHGLGGIMFDDIGPNHRQGTAIFSDSFISDAPAGDVNPTAWVSRMRFWTAVHEMGHCFNLAHSWQKAHPPSWGTPWIPLANENEVRSFMNYPYRVSGGQTAFFADFDYRFSDSELLFMRHAPARFVEMGNAEWFDHHGFQQADVLAEPKFSLELRVNREKAVYEFLEPPVLELKLTNISRQPQLIDDDVLSAGEEMTVIVKKRGKTARQWIPYARYCAESPKIALAPGNAIFHSLFAAVGRNGWDLAEPGVYSIQVALHLEDEDIVSNTLRLQVAPPRGYEEELIAQDFFSDEVGRILTFDGSRVLEKANDTLREVCERLGDRRVAVHAGMAPANPLTRDYKLLNIGEKGARALTSVHAAKGEFIIASAEHDEARAGLDKALTDDATAAVETFGHINYKRFVDRYSDWLATAGDSEAAGKCQRLLRNTLAKRKVADWVLAQIDKRCESYVKKTTAKVKKTA